MLTAVIDIDNTLWDFAGVFYEKIIKINPNIPEPALWDSYYFWRNYVSEEQVIQAIEEIHTNQEMYSPFSEASDFLAFLVIEKGCRIIIASHRDLYCPHLSRLFFYYPSSHPKLNSQLIL